MKIAVYSTKQYDKSTFSMLMIHMALNSNFFDFLLTEKKPRKRPTAVKPCAYCQR